MNWKTVVPSAFFGAYGLGGLLLAITEIVAPGLVSNGTAWGSADGWLREVAGFNIFVAYLAGHALFRRNVEIRSLVAGAFVLLSGYFSANNLAVFFESGAVLHLQNSLMHGLCVLWGLWSLLLLGKLNAGSAP